jgi:hypothetical protein
MGAAGVQIGEETVVLHDRAQEMLRVRRIDSRLQVSSVALREVHHVASWVRLQLDEVGAP